jgi:hypothetical protein
LPDRVERADRLLEFALGELHFADEGMQVLHQSGQDLMGARIGRAVHLLQHRAGDLFLFLDDHWTFLERRSRKV